MEWVSVKTRLPTEEGYYLVAMNDGFVCSEDWIEHPDEPGMCWDSIWAPGYGPTHWMPLPQPPKGEQVKITSEFSAFGYIKTKCAARKGIGSYFCQGECIYNNGTEYDHTKSIITVDCSNPKQKPTPKQRSEG